MDIVARRADALRRLSELQQKGALRPDCADMTRDELLRFVEFLLEQIDQQRRSREEDRKMLESLQTQVEEMTRAMDRNSESRNRLSEAVSRLVEQLEAKDRQIAELEKKLADLTARGSRDAKQKYGTKSLKRTSAHTDDPADRQRGEDDFDGTGGERAAGADPGAGAKPKATPKRGASYSMLRQGGYQKASADSEVFHPTDLGLLPAGCAPIPGLTRDVTFFEEVTTVRAHHMQQIFYRDELGDIHSGFFISDEDPEKDVCARVVKGTHCTTSLLASLLSKRAEFSMPVNRYSKYLAGLGCRINPTTLHNWKHKAADLLENIFPHLQAKALADGSVVNVDETYYLRVDEGRKKHYFWCVVNRKQKAVVFAYDDGSRSREAIKGLIGEADLKGLMSDGYNAYFFLDDPSCAVAHMCCMQHARAKLRHAEDAGESRATPMLDTIAWFYAQERLYKSLGLGPDEVKRRRGASEYQEKVDDLRSRLNNALYFDKDPKGELFEKAISYLNTYWDRLFMYRTDGEFPIDNNIAERVQRTITVDRDNSKCLHSDKGARDMWLLHSFRATCQLLKKSFQRYLQTVLDWITVDGRTDYHNMTPDLVEC